MTYKEKAYQLWMEYEAKGPCGGFESDIDWLAHVLEQVSLEAIGSVG